MARVVCGDEGGRVEHVKLKFLEHLLSKAGGYSERMFKKLFS